MNEGVRLPVENGSVGGRNRALSEVTLPVRASQDAGLPTAFSNERGFSPSIQPSPTGEVHRSRPCNCWRSSFVGPAAKAEAGVGTHYPATSAAANYCPAGLKRLSVGKAVQHPLVTLSCHRKSGVVTSAPRKQGRLLERANQGRGSLDSLFFVGDSCPYIARI